VSNHRRSRWLADRLMEGDYEELDAPALPNAWWCAGIGFEMGDRALRQTAAAQLRGRRRVDHLVGAERLELLQR
jgi:hypothetical protein